MAWGVTCQLYGGVSISALESIASEVRVPPSSSRLEGVLGRLDAVPGMLVTMHSSCSGTIVLSEIVPESANVAESSSADAGGESGPSRYGNRRILPVETVDGRCSPYDATTKELSDEVRWQAHGDASGGSAWLLSSPLARPRFPLSIASPVASSSGGFRRVGRDAMA